MARAQPGRPPGAGTPADPILLPGAVAAAWTSRAQGDLGTGSEGDVEDRRHAVVDRQWVWMRQVHGARAVLVGPGGNPSGQEADALVCPPAPDGPARPADGSDGPALAVFTADCAPLALASPEGVMAAVHAGWRGLAAGIVPAAVAAMRRAGASSVSGALGPCIHAECYEFGPELADVERAVGGPVGSTTRDGRPALDLPAAVARATASAGVDLVFTSPVCTACSAEHFSHRARGDAGRQALVVWRPGGPPVGRPPA